MTGASREGMGRRPGVRGLFWRIWDAERPLGRLLLLHGLGEHSGRYDAYARFLAQEGITVFSFDLRGHGRSEGPRGDIDTTLTFIDDLRGMEGVMEEEISPHLPTFLMGHSMGGLIALARLRGGPSHYQGAVLSAPWLRTGLPDWMRALGRGVGRTFPGLPFPNGIGPDRLTGDGEMMQAWREDPLKHTRISARLFRGVEQIQDEILANPVPLPLSFLFLIPTGDKVVRSEVSLEFARGIVGKGVRVEILEGCRHEPHNDVGREDVYHLVAAWLRELADPHRPET